jgi:VanZ family protein
MALIFYLSSQPAPEQLRRFPIIAKLKLVHMLEYGIMYYLFWFAIYKTTAYNKMEMFMLAFMLTVLYGLIDELHQVFVPERTARLIDAFANGVGACLAEIGRLKFRNN